MVTTFNKKDLVSFGKYLLSEQREESLKNTSKLNETSLPYEEMFREVYDADLQNWLAIKNEFSNVTAVGEMCLESLDPEEFQAWEKVRAGLMRTRKALQKN